MTFNKSRYRCRFGALALSKYETYEAVTKATGCSPIFYAKPSARRTFCDVACMHRYRAYIKGEYDFP